MIELPVPTRLQLRKQPKQKRTLALLEKVIQSTQTLVQQYGYHAVNTNAIAQHANIDIKSLYEFFPNKESILYLIADRWLLSLRQMCLDFESEPYMQLQWRDYFYQILIRCRADGHYETNYHSLQGLWELIPEFTALDDFHREFLIAFHIRQFRRFGATGSDEELTMLCLFLMGMEDGVGLAFAHLDPKQSKQLWQLQYDTYCFHLERILPNSSST